MDDDDDRFDGSPFQWPKQWRKHPERRLGIAIAAAIFVGIPVAVVAGFIWFPETTGGLLVVLILFGLLPGLLSEILDR